MIAKGKVYSIVLALMLAVVLCGCGVPEKTEAEIKEDLNADLSQLGTRTDVVLQTVEITKRQTDQESKTDTVYVDFSLRTEDGVAEGSGSCVMNYNLYNDGWMLENVEIEHIEYVPLKGMELSEEELRNSVLAQYGANAISTEFELIGRSTQWELGTDWYTVSMKNEYKYMTEHLVVSLDFVFDTAGGFWYQNHMGINSSKEEWDIEGTYSVSKSSVEVVLKNKLVQGDIEGCYIPRSHFLDEPKYFYKLSQFSNSVFWGSKVGGDMSYYHCPKYHEYIVEDRFNVKFDYQKYSFCLHFSGELVFIGKNDILYFDIDNDLSDMEIDEYRRVATVIGKTMSRVN